MLWNQILSNVLCFDFWFQSHGSLLTQHAKHSRAVFLYLGCSCALHSSLFIKDLVTNCILPRHPVKNTNLSSKPAKTFICVSWSCSCIVHLSDFTFRSVPLQHMVEVDSHGHFLKEQVPEPPTYCGLNMWNLKKEIHFVKGALSSTYFSSKFSLTLQRLAGR